MRICEAGIPTQRSIQNARGRLTLLRVHDRGGFGNPATGNFIDGEVVFGVDSLPVSRGFGFQLRNDDRGPAHQGMLDLLRDAFVNDLTVSFDHQQDVLSDGRPKEHSEAFRIVLVRD